MPTSQGLITSQNNLRRVVQLNITSSNDSLTMSVAHGLTFQTTGTDQASNVRVSFEPQTGGGASANFFVSSKDATNVTIQATVSGAAASGSSCVNMIMERIHSLVS